MENRVPLTVPFSAGQQKLRALLVEDSELDAGLLLRELRRAGFDVTSLRVQTAAELAAALKEAEWDIVLSDYKMPRFNGMDALAIVRTVAADIPFILISGAVGEETAVAAMRAGASDYFVKGRLGTIGPAIARELREAAVRRARRESEEQVRKLYHAVQQAPVSLMITDVHGVIEYVNPQFTKQTRYAPEEVMGKNPRILKSGLVRREVYEDLWRTIASGFEWRGELQNRTKDGTLFWELVSISPIRDGQGVVTHFLATKLDITEKKRLEEQVLRSQRLESLGMLATGIAHDLNNILAPIMMSGSLLRRIAREPADLRLIATLEKCGERGAGLVRQILGFAHGVSGEPRLVQVKHLMRDIADIVAETFPKSITLHSVIPSDLWPVMANPTQIHQVLLNLCVNARDAMSGGGTLTLRGENRTIDAKAARGISGARPGSWLVMHVEDTGTGIAPDVLARIWDPFFTTKLAGKGTGLGLPSVRGIVEQHHGFVTVQTEVERGTAFTVYLPASIAGPEPGEQESAPLVFRGNNELILIADDEESIRQLAGMTLTRAGYRVLLASDGSEAAALFSENISEIRLVITDIDMPRLNGADLAQAIRAINPSVQILAMSGLSSADRMENFHPETFSSAFIVKPFDVPTLVATVSRLLAGPGTAP